MAAYLYIGRHRRAQPSRLARWWRDRGAHYATGASHGIGVVALPAAIVIVAITARGAV